MWPFFLHRYKFSFMSDRSKITETRLLLTDLGVLTLLAAILYGFLLVAREWHSPLQQEFQINLSLWALPGYAFLSMLRGFLAYVLSLIFTLIYGYVAVHRPKADRIMIPILDVLQSIPVLGFLPSAVLALVAIFPHTNTGLELACILMIFTGQVWNMTFSFYQSLKTIPAELLEASSIYQFNWWQRFLRVELPASAVGLTWNSMMAMAGGWFFLMICEAFTLGSRDFRLPGLGAYMSVAVVQHDVPAMLAGIFTMMIMIVLINFCLWRPLILWAQKFRIEETATPKVASSRIFDFFSKSRVWQVTVSRLALPVSEWLAHRAGTKPKTMDRFVAEEHRFGIIRGVSYVIFGGILLGSLFFSWKLGFLLVSVSVQAWLQVLLGALLTFLRVFAAVILGSLWTIPLGVWIGLKQSRSNRFQPIVQLAASFPAPMLYPLILMGMKKMGVGLNITSIVLMMMGTQWYILFNVIAGASSIPQEFREVSQSYQFSRWQNWKIVWLPAIFPFLMTGWVTAAGGAWNASIVAEYIFLGKESFIVPGLGSLISNAASQASFDLLASGVLVMAVAVILINRFLWKPLYRLSETRYSR